MKGKFNFVYKSVFFIFVFFSIIFFSQNVFSVTIPDNSYLVFSVINQNPDPAVPGGVVDLRVRVDNLGLEKADSYKYEILLDKGFEVLSDKTVYKGSIDGYQQGDEGAVLFWKIKLSNDLVGSEYYTFRIKYYNDKNTFYTQPLTLRVKDVPNNIYVKDIYYDFKTFKPGSEGKIVLTLKNSGSKTFYSVKTVLSSDVLSFKNNVVEKDFLKPGDEETFVTDAIIKPTVVPGVYAVSINLEFYDENYNLIKKSYSSNIKVFEKPDYFLTLEDGDLKTKGKGKIVVSISNVGSEKLKYLVLKLNSNEEYYDILSPDEIYIGNLDSDDYETGEFEVYVKKDGVIPFNVSVIFKDSFGNLYYENKILNYEVYNFRTAEKYGFYKRNYSFIFLLLLVLFSIPIVFFRRKKGPLRKLKK